MTIPLRKSWIPRETLADISPADVVGRAEVMCREQNLDPLIARLLALRGLEPTDVDLFLNGNLSHIPDPFLMKGMGRAVGRLMEAIRSQERILVHGDYDCDGVTGTTLLVEVLRSLGAQNVDFFIPLRLRDGYGLSETGIREAAQKHTPVIVSVDCGISAINEATVAHELGIDLIITDHHQAPEVLPGAYAIVNPHQPGCEFPSKGLAGVGVAFFLAVALRKSLREAGHFRNRPEPDLRKVLDLVALGSIADIVPLTGINRVLVSAGLSLMQNSPRVGVAALQQAASIRKVSCGTVAFGLGPRLNAAGRIEDATLGVELLLEQDFDRAMTIAGTLHALNQERQEIEAEVVTQAVERVEAGEGGQRTIVLADERWHLGVIGIAASRLVEIYHRPTILIALQDGVGKGSARSIRGFNLFLNLQEIQSLLKGFGGHAYAAGLSIDEANIKAFAREFDLQALRLLSEQDMVPHLPYDAEVDLDSLTIPTLEQISVLAPFGAGNPNGVFVARQVRVQRVRVLKEKHLSFFASQGGRPVKCIAFGRAHDAERLEGSTVDILFNGSINDYRGERTVQCEIKDLRRAS